MLAVRRRGIRTTLHVIIVYRSDVADGGARVHMYNIILSTPRRRA